MPLGSVTRWIHLLKRGDQAAAQQLWERYHARLLGLARQVLRESQRRHADEEDVVQIVFSRFFRGVSEGRFPRLNDRDNLWRLLVVLTARKAIDQIAAEGEFVEIGAPFDADDPLPEVVNTTSPVYVGKPRDTDGDIDP